MKIIKFNKNTQNKLDLKLDDYIKYYKPIPKIEIELSISSDISDEKNSFINIDKNEFILSYLFWW